MTFGEVKKFKNYETAERKCSDFGLWSSRPMLNEPPKSPKFWRVFGKKKHSRQPTEKSNSLGGADLAGGCGARYKRLSAKKQELPSLVRFGTVRI